MTKNRLLWRLLAATVFLFLVAISTAFALFYALESQQVRSRMLSELNRQNEIAIPLVSQYYLSGDIASLRSYLEAWASLSGISGAFHDNDGNVIWTNFADPANLDLFLRFPVRVNNSEVGTMEVGMTEASARADLKSKYSMLLLFGLGLALVFSFALLFVGRRTLAPLREIFESFKNEARESGYQLTEKQGDELNTIQLWFRELSQAWRQERDRAAEGAKAMLYRSLARQVAHDIRSPLSALSIAASSLGSVSQSEKNLIQSAAKRIDDIATNLLQKGDQAILSLEGEPSPREVRPYRLTPVLSQIVEEKSIRYLHRSHLSIVGHLHEVSSVQVNANPSDLMRALSNLIDNAVDSIDGPGLVEVRALVVNRCVQLRVSDNGCGIAADLIDRLGVPGVSHGKELKSNSGFGLGLSQVRQFAEESGGRFWIESQLGLGTSVYIEIPTTRSSAAFVGGIDIMTNCQFISIDDDPSIHLAWSKRIESSGITEVIHKSFFSAEEFTRWYNCDRSPRDLYLVDHELGENQMTGLDLIEKLNISHQSILVTATADQPHFQERCRELGIRCLSKSEIAKIPICLKLEP